MSNYIKFHEVRIKTKKVMEGGRIPPPPLPLDWETSNKKSSDKNKECLSTYD